MNILHVLSQFEVTGAEAYAACLIDEQVSSGHKAVVVSDTLTLPTRATYVQLPIGMRSYPQRLRNIIKLVRLIRAHSIDLVHAHSRAASWVSLFATRLTGTAFVSTIHGRQHVHPSSKAFSIYGRDIITVSSTLKQHLIQDLRFDPDEIVVIPNCIALEKWKKEKLPALSPATPKSSNDEILIVFIGRLTGPKGDVVRSLLRRILPSILSRKDIKFQAIGGMIVPDDIPPLVSELNARNQRPVVELCGFQKGIAERIVSADLVIGSGRVVPETLALCRPVIAFGETSYIGLITQESFEAASATNFGDTGITTPSNPERVAADILQAVDHPSSEQDRITLSQMAIDRFDARRVSEKVYRMYERAFARVHSPQSVPVLMYHRVLEKEPDRSSHGIWVTAKQFEWQLRSLRRRGFETITFRDYEQFLRGTRQLPHKPIILTFDDGYEDNYTVAFPILQESGYRAVIYAVTDSKRRTNFWDHPEPCAALLSPAQLEEIQRAGNEIGSHTVTHRNLPSIAPRDARAELINSKTALEQMLGTEIISVAYPYGAVSSAVKDLAEEAGYKFAVAADSGPTKIHLDFLEIRRTQVFPWTSRTGFWKKSLPIYNRYKEMKR
jgi:peptidoglycan/xylan/chitin deacetylase (PgdA/CDA1 family)/glycosyltransferase involved in cell wall biosynthesis